MTSWQLSKPEKIRNIPKITSPCPLRSTAAHRQVTNPDTMDYKQKKMSYSPFTNECIFWQGKGKIHLITGTIFNID